MYVLSERGMSLRLEFNDNIAIFQMRKLCQFSFIYYIIYVNYRTFAPKTHTYILFYIFSTFINEKLDYFFDGSLEHVVKKQNT